VVSVEEEADAEALGADADHGFLVARGRDHPTIRAKCACSRR
jgi:hypothetical protein